MPELHAVAMLVVQKLTLLWRSTKEVNMVCPTRFVVDTTEKSKEGGGAVEVCRSQT